MVEVGSCISACLERIEPRGAYLTYGNEVVFVPAGNFSWPGEESSLEWAMIGEVLYVFVLRYNYDTLEIVGSFKHLRPDRNPYRILARLDPGTELQGRVLQLTKEGAIIGMIEIGDGATGMVPAPCLRFAPALKQWQDVTVQITAIEPDSEVLRLKLSSSDQQSR